MDLELGPRVGEKLIAGRLRAQTCARRERTPSDAGVVSEQTKVLARSHSAAYVGDVSGNDRFRRRLRRPSPALIVACLALFVALGGTGYAAMRLPRNSVGAHQLRKGAVTAPKLGRSAIKMLQHKLGKRGPRGAQGAQGAPGSPGATGAVGPQGSPGAPGATKVVARYGNVQSGPTGGVSFASCQAGETVTGGGWDFTTEPAGSTTFRVDADRPSNHTTDPVDKFLAPPDGSAPQGWLVYIVNPSTSVSFRAYALCASP